MSTAVASSMAAPLHQPVDEHSPSPRAYANAASTSSVAPTPSMSSANATSTPPHPSIISSSRVSPKTAADGKTSPKAYVLLFSLPSAVIVCDTRNVPNFIGQRSPRVLHTDTHRKDSETATTPRSSLRKNRARQVSPPHAIAPPSSTCRKIQTRIEPKVLAREVP